MFAHKLELTVGFVVALTRCMMNESPLCWNLGINNKVQCNKQALFLWWASHQICRSDGHLTRYVKLWIAHAPGMPGTFSTSPRISDPDMHHGMCVTHVPWCIPGSPLSVFLWSRWRGKSSRRSRRMSNTQFYVSGKRPMLIYRSLIVDSWDLFFHRHRDRCVDVQVPVKKEQYTGIMDHVTIKQNQTITERDFEK